MKTDVLFAAIDGHATAEALPRDLLLLLTDLAVECVGVLQRGEAVGLVRGVGPAASASAGVTASSARRGGAPAVLAAVGKLALKAENKMTLVYVRKLPLSRARGSKAAFLAPSAAGVSERDRAYFGKVDIAL